MKQAQVLAEALISVSTMRPISIKNAIKIARANSLWKLAEPISTIEGYETVVIQTDATRSGQTLLTVIINIAL